MKIRWKSRQNVRWLSADFHLKNLQLINMSQKMLMIYGKDIMNYLASFGRKRPHEDKISSVHFAHARIKKHALNQALYMSYKKIVFYTWVRKWFYPRVALFIMAEYDSI